MCGDHYSRTPTVDSGDLVAIIHPSSQQRPVFSGGRLHLSNRFPGSTVSTLKCSRHHDHGNAASSFPPSSGFDNDDNDDTNSSSSASSSSSTTSSSTPSLLSVRIHKFGQPLLALNGTESANPVLHSFAVSPCASVCASASANAGVGDETCLVGRRLNLGVGGDGVVGRTVSLVDEQRQVVLGEGVIGWI